MKKILSFLLIFFAPVILNAQQSDSARYVPALEMAANGDVSGGRAMIDSILGTIQHTAPEYAEGLYWRASIAEDPKDAERDYRRIIVDYPLSPRVEGVLLNLAQVEMARGDKDAAFGHLQRLTLEYPNGYTRPQASYIIAQILLARNDTQRGCVALADALARTSPKNIELRNQISFLELRCPQASQQTTIIGADENPQAVPAADDAQQPVVLEPETPTVTPKPAAKPTAKTTTKSAAPATGKFSVQVGAYTKKSQADAFAATLRMRGFSVRVDGAKSPYRVRIGKYSTREEAVTALERVKAAKLDGFVVGI